MGGSYTNINLNGTTSVVALRTGSIDSAGAIVIGATATPLTIGNSSSTTSMLGTTTISSLATNTVDRATFGALTIAPTTATSLVLGNATTCNTSNLGTFTSTGGIIANGNITSLTYNGITSTGDVNLALSQISGTGNINIGTGLVRSSAINIGTLNSSTINIGNTGLTTIGTGGLTSTGLVTANGGLTIGGSNNITLGNGTVAPASSTQLGYQQTGGTVTNTILINTITQISSITLTTAGLYYFQSNTAFQSVVSYNSSSISTSTTINNPNCQTQLASNGLCNPYHNNSFIYRVTASQVIYLLANSNVAQTIQAQFFQATRIA